MRNSAKKWNLRNSKTTRIIAYIAAVVVIDTFINWTDLASLTHPNRSMGDYAAVDMKRALVSDRAKIAYTICNDRVSQQLGAYNVNFSTDSEFSAWNMDLGTFLIRSEFRQQKQPGGLSSAHYVCQLRYLGNDKFDKTNWELDWLRIT